MIIYGSTPGQSGRIAERYLEGFRFDAWMGVKMPNIDTRGRCAIMYRVRHVRKLMTVLPSQILYFTAVELSSESR